MAAAACLAQIEGDDNELQQQLAVIIALKRDAIHTAFWHATFGSPEFERLMALKKTPFPLGLRAEMAQDIQTALSWLNAIHIRLGDSVLEIESARLEQHYQRIQQYPWAGHLFFTLALFNRDLRRATQALQQRLDERPSMLQQSAQ